MSSRQHLADANLNLRNLAVMMPIAEYLLAMKCLAPRIESESRNLDDVKFLIRHLKLRGADEVLSIVENYYPRNLIAVKTQYFGEATFEDLTTG